MNIYVQGTQEFITVTVSNNGVPVTEGVQYQMSLTRPTEDGWADPDTDGDQMGIMLTGEELRGVYGIYAKIASPPETPVVYCDSIKIS